MNEVQLMIDWVTNGYIHDTAMLIQLVYKPGYKLPTDCKWMFNELQ